MASIRPMSAICAEALGIGPEIAQKERAKVRVKGMTRTMAKEDRKEKPKAAKDQQQDVGTAEAITTTINAR